MYIFIYTFLCIYIYIYIYIHKYIHNKHTDHGATPASGGDEFRARREALEQRLQARQIIKSSYAKK